MKDVNGVMTALITPFTPEGAVDEKGLKVLIDRQIEAGIKGICVVAGSGEYVNLTKEEREKVVKLSVQYADHRIYVISGVFEANTASAVESAKMAERNGADAVLVLTPYYNKPSVDGLKLYFKTIAESINIPVIIYNNPGRCTIDLSGMYKDFIDIPNVIGVKECNRDMGVFSSTVQEMSNKWRNILCGDDDIFLPMLSIGAGGTVLTTSNIVPRKWVELYDTFKSNDTEKARSLHYELLPLISAVYTLNHPALVKKCMQMMGLPAGTTRSPLVAPTDKQVAKIAEVIERLGLKK